MTHLLEKPNTSNSPFTMLVVGEDSERIKALNDLFHELNTGHVLDETLMEIAVFLIENFPSFAKLVHLGNSLHSPTEICIKIIDMAGLSGEITQELIDASRNASLPSERASAIQALKFLDRHELEELVVERLQNEQSTLVLSVLVELARELRFRSTIFCIRKIIKNNLEGSADTLLDEIGREYLANY